MDIEKGKFCRSNITPRFCLTWLFSQGHILKMCLNRQQYNERNWNKWRSAHFSNGATSFYFKSVHFCHCEHILRLRRKTNSQFTPTTQLNSNVVTVYATLHCVALVLRMGALLCHSKWSLPYLTLPPGWASSYTCPALRPYQFSPMRVPEFNHKVTGNCYKAVNSCEAVNKQLWSHSWLWSRNQHKSTGNVRQICSHGFGQLLVSSYSPDFRNLSGHRCKAPPPQQGGCRVKTANNTMIWFDMMTSLELWRHAAVCYLAGQLSWVCVVKS